MKLFNRQKTVTNIPPELQQYYQAPQQENNSHRTIIIIIASILVAALVIAGAVWGIVQLTSNKGVKPQSQVNQAPQTNNGNSPQGSSDSPATTPLSGQTNKGSAPQPAQ